MSIRGVPPTVPSAPRSERPQDLGFTRRSMVGWFDPAQLARTGLQAVLSAVFGSYADKREMQAALLATDKPSDYSDTATIWIDYLADTGDGWDSTYTMARLVGAPELTVVDRGAHRLLPRARLLVLGGDQVYPTATRDAYQDRFVGPFTAALPGVIGEPAPAMFALPGNHDWYDGLTSFLRLFCQGRWIGGWRTWQSRSYFAIRLPHRWWLWGIDTQFESDIDKPQLDYFKLITGAHVRPGDRIILCTGTPTWVESSRGRPQGYRNLCFFVEKVIAGAEAELVLLLTGDLHTYCRYEAATAPGKMMIIAGGGGAYLFGTHQLPTGLELNEGAVPPRTAVDDGPEPSVAYARAAVYPSAAESRRLGWGVLAFPFLARKFSLCLAAWYLLFAWLIQSASTWLITGDHPSSLLEDLAGRPLHEIDAALTDYVRVLAHSPSVVALCLVLVVGLALFAGFERRWHPIVGAAHGVGHLVLSAGLVWLLAWTNRRRLGFASFEAFGQVIAFSAEMFVVGGLLGGFAMGVYLFLADRLFGLHTNEVFSAQRIEGYKNFLRLHIDAEGALTVYPLGVRRVGRRWRLNQSARNGQPWFDPVGVAPSVELIEDPIAVAPGQNLQAAPTDRARDVVSAIASTRSPPSG